MLNEDIIVISVNGFDISSCRKDRLSFIGAQAFLVFTGYLKNRDLANCVTSSPHTFREKVREIQIDYQQKLIRGERLENNAVEVYLTQSVLSVHGEYRLYILLRDNRRFEIYKRMLLRILS